MLVHMWRNAHGGIYLEPGEISLLADLARRAIPAGPVTHPSALMLQALAAALSEMVDGPGVMVAPAPSSAVRLAAQAYVRGDVSAAPPGRRSSGPHAAQPA